MAADPDLECRLPRVAVAAGEELVKVRVIIVEVGAEVVGAGEGDRRVLDFQDRERVLRGELWLPKQLGLGEKLCQRVKESLDLMTVLGGKRESSNFFYHRGP